MGEKSQGKLVINRPEDWPLSFQYPEDWELHTPPAREGVTFLLRGPLDPSGVLFASISVRVRSGQGRTLPSLSREWVSRRSAFRTFRLLARTETDLAGIPAIQIDGAHDMPLPVHTINAEMVTIQERVIFALRDERIYELTYRATGDDFEERLPVFEALVASFSPGG